VVRARFLSRAGDRISPRDVLALAGESGPSPALADEVARWNADQAR